MSTAVFKNRLKLGQPLRLYYSQAMSRGRANVRPEDAKWIFRWTQPVVSIDPGDASVTWPGGAPVEVITS